MADLSPIVLRRLVIVACVFCGFLTLWFVRTAVIAPIDGFVTAELCRSHADELGRSVTGVVRSNRLGLWKRSHASCSFGPSEDDEQALTLSVDEIGGDSLYILVKAMGIVVQFGVLSLLARLLVSPIGIFLDWYERQ